MGQIIGFVLSLILIVLAIAVLSGPLLGMGFFGKLLKKHMWKRAGFFLLVLLLLGFIANRSIFGIIYWDGPYHGRVVDAESGAPIKGAVVAGLWEFEYNILLITTSIGFANAAETVTDDEGRFVLPRIWAFTFWPLSRLDSLNLLVFKPGYDSHPPNMHRAWTKEDEQKRGLSRSEYHDKFWISCVRDQECLVQLNKPTTAKEQDKVALSGISFGFIPMHGRLKIKELIKLINEERRGVGADEWQVE